MPRKTVAGVSRARRTERRNRSVHKVHEDSEHRSTRLSECQAGFSRHPQAKVAELVDALDSKSSGCITRVGSSPTFGTTVSQQNTASMEKMYSPWREVYMESFKDEKHPFHPAKDIFTDIPPEEDEERYVLHRAEKSFIIMNLFPYNCGHLMVIPFKQTPELSELDDTTKLEIMKLTDVCMEALRKTIHPHGFNFGVNVGKVAGGSVDSHIHFHIVPRWEGDTNFMPVVGETKVLSNDMRRLYKQLRETIKEIMQEKAGQ